MPPLPTFSLVYSADLFLDWLTTRTRSHVTHVEVGVCAGGEGGGSLRSSLAGGRWLRWLSPPPLPPPPPHPTHRSSSSQTDPFTLSAWILDQQHKARGPDHPRVRGRLTMLINAISVGCKFVSSAVRRAGLAGTMGMAGSSNVQASKRHAAPAALHAVPPASITSCALVTVPVRSNPHPP